MCLKGRRKEFQIFSALKICVFFRVITPCILAGEYQLFGETLRLYRYSQTLNNGALYSSKMLLTIYQFTRRHNLEGKKMNSS
jgi:hypothetical protein